MRFLGKEAFYNWSLERALKILCVLKTDKKMPRLSPLSQILDMSKATVLRSFLTLTKYDFRGYGQQSKQYSLGLKLFGLGLHRIFSLSVRRVAGPFLGQSQPKLGESVSLGIIQNDEIAYVDKKDAVRS